MITGLFSLNQDLSAFKEHLRDFLVQIKVLYCIILYCVHDLRSTTKLPTLSRHVLPQEFHGEDLSDLYLDEREASLKQAQEEKRRVQISVPGILNPYDMPEEMQD